MTEPMNSMTQQELEEIKQAEQAATPGPWEYDLEEGEIYALNERGCQVRYVVDDGGTGTGCCISIADAAFIALARTAVPRLLTEVTRLQSALEAEKKRTEAAVSFLNRMAEDPHWCDACKKCPCVEKGKVPLPGYCDFEWDGTDGKIEDRLCADNTKGATYD